MSGGCNRYEYRDDVLLSRTLATWMNLRTDVTSINSITILKMESEWRVGG